MKLILMKKKKISYSSRQLKKECNLYLLNPHKEPSNVEANI